MHHGMSGVSELELGPKKSGGEEGGAKRTVRSSFRYGNDGAFVDPFTE
jgi:hypothetical protein